MNLKIMILNANPIKTKEGQYLTRYEYAILDPQYCQKARGTNFVGSIVVNGFHKDGELYQRLSDFVLQPVDAVFDYRADFKDPMNQKFVLKEIKGKNGSLSLL